MVIRIGAAATQRILNMASMSPTTQRLIIGATGLVSHTTIDAFNPFVDKNTRKYAAVRSAVKMVIGTMSGIMTREVGQKLGEYVVKSGKIPVPEGISKAVFTSSVGNVFAIVGAVVSIFLIDVPFINKLLNVVMRKFFHAGASVEKGNSRGNKVDYNA